MMVTPFGPDHVQSGDDLNADPASHLASAVNTNGIAIIATNHLQASTASAAPSTPLEPRAPSQAQALDSSMLALLTLSTSPFWVHRYIRFFLNPVRESARTSRKRQN
jgi:hypothetical protein